MFIANNKKNKTSNGMNKFSRGLVSIILASLLLVTTNSPVLAKEEVRIEDDLSLSYPVGKTDEIVAHLKSKYIDATSFVKSLGPNFTSSFGDEDFTDIYFDTPNLDLYKRKIGLRHRLRVNRLDSEDRKNGRELIQLKLSGDDKFTDTDNSGSRNEIKYEVVRPETIADRDDKHQLLGLIARDQRDDFKDRIKELGLDVYKLRPILTIKQRRQRVYINRDNATFVSFSMDDSQSRRWWAKAEFSQLELELNELAYTEADEVERERMKEIRKSMVKDLREHFDYLKSDKTIKYQKAFDLLAVKIPWMRFWVKIGLM